MKGYEIDYKKMYEEASGTIKELFDMQSEFFDLMQYVNDHAKAAAAVPDNIFKMKLPDQVLYLRSVKKNLEICEYIVKKYGFEVPEGEDDEN